MNKNGKGYEAPKMKVYQFDDNDQILTLTESGELDPTDPTDPTADYAADALNNLFENEINTTIEK